MDSRINSEKYYAAKIKEFLKCKDSQVSIKIYKTKKDYNSVSYNGITELFYLIDHGGAYISFSYLTIYISKFKKLSLPLKKEFFKYPYKNSELISMLAHEYGHYLSRLNLSWRKKAHEAYHLVKNSSGGHKKYYASIILEEENKAWDLGKEFLQKIGCKIPKCFSYIKRKSIKQYKDYYEI